MTDVAVTPEERAEIRRPSEQWGAMWYPHDRCHKMMLRLLNALEATEHRAEQAEAKNARLREAAYKLAGVELLCKGFNRGRGIWKQVDENRELLQFLFSEFPEIKERAFFIENWVEATDLFLNCLIELLELKQPHPSAFFPRRWPGLLDVVDAKEFTQFITSQIKRRPF